MNFRFQNLLGAPYRGGNAVISNNTLLLSPVGNRVAVTDLLKSETSTLPIQSSSNVARIAVSPDATFLLAVDDRNRCLFINLRRRALLHRISFKDRVAAIEFSPDGALIAVATGKLVQIWRSPAFRREYFPFELVRTFAEFDSKVTTLDWSPDSKYLIVGSKDLTARILCLKKLNSRVKKKPFLLLGHRDSVVGSFFGVNSKTSRVCKAYTVTRDCYLFSWGFTSDGVGEAEGSEPPSPETPERDVEGNLEVIENDGVKKRKKIDVQDGDEGYLSRGKWELLRKDGFMQGWAKVTACDYHRGLDMVVVGFSNGVFGLYQMPDIVCIHLLSISREKITTAVFNELGNWLTFGCAKLGQLLVWEWRSESYILKQQGHYFDVNCVAYSADSQLLATGADDNKVKVWTLSSGFCSVTFSEHTNAVTALHFMASSNCLLSASLDGTIRAWDLLRYRNFRTFTTPSSRQFVSLTADQSGEVICAGTSDSFEIFVWSMRTGRLLDVLSGHEAPVHGLVFSPTNAVLASSSYDKTVRLWDVFDGKGAVETFPHTHDVLTVVYRPDGRQLACSTLDGQIHFWDPIDGLLMYTIEGSRDIAGGRLMTDSRLAANSTSGKFFTTLCYSADGSYILAGGSSRYICMYDVADQVLLRRFQITHNLSLDGVLDILNSKNMTDVGPLDLIDDNNSDIGEGIEKQTRGKLGFNLPGSMPNRGRPVIQTKCLRIAPTGRSFVAATTEGVLVYSVDESFKFDPTDLDINVTPEKRIVVAKAEEAEETKNEVRIFVGGLAEAVSVEDLRSLFSSLGTVQAVQTIRTKGRSFAYIDFHSNSKSLSKLFSKYNGCLWKGGRLRLEKAKEDYLARMKREWEHDALDDATQPLPSSPEETTTHSSKPNTKHLNIFFPRLRKVKAIPSSGTGKHKYSFQNIKVPPLPVHFCDCEEHCSPFVSERRKQYIDGAAESGGMNDEEISIMNAVMNKLLQKEKVSSAENLGKEKDSYKSLDALQPDECEDSATDEDDLIINMETKRSKTTLIGNQELERILENKESWLNKTKIAKEEPNKSMPQVEKKNNSNPNKNKKRKLIPKLEMESNAEVSTTPEGKGDMQTRLNKVGSGAQPTKSEDGFGELTKVSWSQKSSWKELLGGGGNTSFSAFLILPKLDSSKNLQRSDDLCAPVSTNNRTESMERDSELWSNPTNTQVIKEHGETQPTNKQVIGDVTENQHNAAPNKTGRGASWLQKQSWTQMVSENNNSFSISHILPGITFPEPKAKDPIVELAISNYCMHNGVAKDTINEVVSDGFKSRESIQEKSQHIGANDIAFAPIVEEKVETSPRKKSSENIEIGETCSFMRNAASLKEWAKAKAAISGSLKRKGGDK